MQDVDYDTVIEELFGSKLYRESIEVLVEFAQIPVNASVLELCCGTGISSNAILRKTKNLVAVELNQRRMDIAKQSLPHDVRLLSVNAQELNPEKHGRYDYVLCINGFHYFEPEEFYEIAARMLHPRGKLVFNVKLHDYYGVRPLHTQLSHVVAQAVAEAGYCKGNLDLQDVAFLDSLTISESFSVHAPFAISRSQEYAAYHSSGHIHSDLFWYWCQRYFRLIDRFTDYQAIRFGRWHSPLFWNKFAPLQTRKHLFFQWANPDSSASFAYDYFEKRFDSFISSLKPDEHLAKAELFAEAVNYSWRESVKP